MAYAKSDTKIIGFLGRALSLEMTAVQQYLTMSRLLRLRGFDELAQRLHKEATEELSHADRIIGRMLIMGVSPNMTQLRSPQLGESLPELMVGAQALEKDIVSLYQQAVDHCIRLSDFDNRLFFDQLLQEEKQHVNDFGNWQQNLTVEPILPNHSKED